MIDETHTQIYDSHAQQRNQPAARNEADGQDRDESYSEDGGSR